MKISFVSEIDFANVLTEYSFCLNKHSDIKCKSVCLNKHPFNYNIQHDYDLFSCTNKEKIEAKDFIEKSDIIIFGEENKGNYNILNQIKNILNIDLLRSNKKLIIWHPGSNYRSEYNFYNNHPLRNKIYKHFYGIDLYRLSNKELNDLPIHAYQYVDFNYNKFIEKFKLKLKNKPWVILHIPSKTQTKGTNIINKVINRLDLDPNKFQYKVLTNIPHSVSINEKEKSLFYIDQFFPQGCGGYGVSTLESLFSSNLTFSTINNITDSIFKLTGKYECPVVHLGNNEEELFSILNHFFNNTTNNELIKYMEGIGQWLEQYYSIDSIIKYFKSL